MKQRGGAGGARGKCNEEQVTGSRVSGLGSSRALGSVDLALLFIKYFSIDAERVAAFPGGKIGFELLLQYRSEGRVGALLEGSSLSLNYCCLDIEFRLVRRVFVDQEFG